MSHVQYTHTTLITNDTPAIVVQLMIVYQAVMNLLDYLLFQEKEGRSVDLGGLVISSLSSTSGT